MDDEIIEFENSIRVHEDEFDQPPGYMAPQPPSISIRINLEQVPSNFSIESLITQIFSSVQSSNDDSSAVGEVMELAAMHLNVGNPEEHPMLSIDIRPRRDESGYEHALPAEPPRIEELSNQNRLILFFIYFCGIAIAFLTIVLIVVVFFPDFFECIIMQSDRCSPNKYD